MVDFALRQQPGRPGSFGEQSVNELLVFVG
jgi:hypothetical protein